jgi:hypothetical protein
VNWRDWLASGGAAPRLVLCAGIVAAALVARALFGEPNRPARGGARAPAASPARAEARAVRGPQVQLLGGPRTRDADAGERRTGDVTSAAHLEADRRQADLNEVLRRLDGAPVWVEGIDGPAPAGGTGDRTK